MTESQRLQSRGWAKAFILAISLAVTSAHAQEQGHAPTGRPSQAITPATLNCAPSTPSFEISSPSLPSAIHTLSSKQISELLGKSAGGHSHQSKVAGLYLSRYSVSGAHALRTYEFSNGGPVGVCLDDLSLEIALKADILIASELPLGGCADKDAYSHESTHHRIQVQQQNAAVAAFLASPNGKLPKKPFWGSTKEQAVATLGKWEQAYLNAIGMSISNYVDPVQRALDSPQEYARFSLHCAAEFDKIRFRP